MKDDVITYDYNYSGLEDHHCEGMTHDPNLDEQSAGASFDRVWRPFDVDKMAVI